MNPAYSPSARRDTRAEGRAPVRGAPIAISMGDPAGVGPEVIVRSAVELARRRRTIPLLVLGDLKAMRLAARRIRGAPLPYSCKAGEPFRSRRGALPVIEVSRLSPRALTPGKPSIEGARAAYSYIVAGARMAIGGEAAALVTAPISKEWLNRAGFRFAGHSELLAELSGAGEWRMMFTGGELKLVLVTVHIGLAKVPRALGRDRIFNTLRLFNAHLQAAMEVRRPRIIVLGLNPHAGENGLFGREELDIIAPAIARARRAGIDATGPLPPDTAFIRPRGRFEFDGAVAMYHDQGLIALKTLEFDRAVNVTLGIPFVRTSPDHGTAYGIAGRGLASGASMLAAIDYAWECVRRQARPQ